MEQMLQLFLQQFLYQKEQLFLLLLVHNKALRAQLFTLLLHRTVHH